MKVRADQLAAHLKKNLLPIYIISGDETLLVQEACDLIRQACRAQEYQEREILQAEGTSFNWDLLISSANNYSLFSKKCLLELRLPTGKPGTQGSKILQAYTEQLPTDKLLLIITQKLESSSANSVWMKAIDKVGGCIQIWPLERQQLPQWIAQRATRLGLQLTNAGAQLLANRNEGNLLALDQEITKLSLIFDQANISTEEIMQCATDSARFDVFTWVDAALAGDAARVTRIARNLRAEASETTLMLWALVKEIRQLAILASAASRGENIEMLLTKLGVWEKRKALMKQALKRHNALQFENMLQQAVQIDQQIKGQAQGNVWDALLALALHLGGLTNLCKIISSL